MKHIIAGIDDVKIHTFFNNKAVISFENFLPNLVLILDDVIGEYQKIIKENLSRVRHNKIDIFYLAQSYLKVPKLLIRDNDYLIVLFKQNKTNLKNVQKID